MTDHDVPEAYTPPQPAATRPVSGFSITSLVLGVVAVLLMGRLGLVALLAVALGIEGIRRGNRELNSGRGLAIAGVVLGGVGVALAVVRIAGV